MKVRIVKSEHQGYWYAEQIGSIITAFDKDGYDFHVPGCGDISKSDCEILPEENQPEPFDLERALKGEKVVTREGVVVDELYHFKTYHGLCPITAIIDGEKKTFRIDGKYNESGRDTRFDLLMAPRESEYVTKWVNLYDDNITDRAIRSSHAFHEKQEALNCQNRLKDENYIGTFPITFKRPS